MISFSYIYGDRMEDYFGPEGLLKKRLQKFEYRRPQSELAEKIDRFLASDAHLLAAEAPTGVGKTFAMLVPAMRWAAENNQTVLVLTSGITLQEQLIGKDIPALAAKTKVTNKSDGTTGGTFHMTTADIEAVLRLADR